MNHNLTIVKKRIAGYTAHFFRYDATEDMGFYVSLLCEVGQPFIPGYDFFEGEEAPYPVFNLATGRRVFVVEEKKQCPTCHGKGRRTLQELAVCRAQTLEQMKADLERGHLSLADLLEDTFQCMRCGGLGYEMEKVEVEK